MDLHLADIKHRLTRFLGRKAEPRHLSDPEAQADEVNALVAAIRSRAPRDAEALAGWWSGFEQALDSRCGRTWPSVQDVQEAARALAPAPSARVSEPTDRDPAVIVAARMNAGEPVGEDWLFGILACELGARQLVSRDVMTQYRSSAFHNRRTVYGEEAALAWEAEAKARHEAAKAIWKSRKEQRQKLDLSRHMPAAQTW